MKEASMNDKSKEASINGKSLANVEEVETKPTMFSKFMQKWPRKVEMTGDGFPKFSPESPFSDRYHNKIMGISFFASLLAVVGTDVITLSFPENDADIATISLLTVLLCYFSVEFLCYCLFVREYIFSWFFCLDILCLLGIATEFTSFAVLAYPTAIWNTFNVNTFHSLPLVRSGRGARFVARIGRFSSLRFTKVMMAPMQRRSHEAGHGKGYAAQFGRKGYEDEKYLFPYIKEKFQDAFQEADKEHGLNRDDFTMMIRSLLKLDLENEEEELMYRIMTLFGRSQEMKYFEENQDTIEPHLWSKMRGPGRRTGSRSVSLSDANEIRDIMNKNRPSNVETSLATITQGGGTDTALLDPSNAVLKKVNSSRRSSMPSVSANRAPMILNKDNGDEESPGNRNSDHAKSENNQSSGLFGGGNRRSLFFVKSDSSTNDHSEASVPEKSRSSSSGTATTPSPSSLTPKTAISRLHFPQRLSRLRRVASSISLNTRTTNAFSIATRTSSAPYGDDLELKPNSEKMDELVQSAISVGEMKKFEEANPIMALRLKMTTTNIPVGIDTLDWGLHLFKNIDGSQPYDVSEKRTFASKAYICESEFQSRLDEVLVVDGAHIFDSLKALHKRLEAAHHSSNQKKNTTSGKDKTVTFGTSLSSYFRSTADYSRGSHDSVDTHSIDSKYKSSQDIWNISSNNVSKPSKEEGDQTQANFKISNYLGGKKVAPAELVSRSGSRSKSAPSNTSDGNTDSDDEEGNDTTTSIKKHSSFLRADGKVNQYTIPARPSSAGAERKYDSSKKKLTFKVLSGDDGSVNSSESDSLKSSIEMVQNSAKKALAPFPSFRFRSTRISSEPSHTSTLPSELTLQEESSTSSRVTMNLGVSGSTPDDSSDGLVGKLMKSSYQNELSAKWIRNVVEKVRLQMKDKMKQDIEKDLKFGSGDNIADHVSRGSIRVAFFGVFITLLAAPSLQYPNHVTCDDINGSPVFNILRSTVRSFENISYSGGLITSKACQEARSSLDINIVLDEYLDMDPPPFLIRIDGCTLLSDDRYSLTGYDDDIYLESGYSRNRDHYINLNAYQVNYLPCKSDIDELQHAMNEGKNPYDTNDEDTFYRHTEKFTMAAFDMRHIRFMEAMYSLTLSVAVITLLLVMSIILGRDTAVITEVIVSPLTRLAQDMDRVSRFDLSSRRVANTSVPSVRYKSKFAQQLVKSIVDGEGGVSTTGESSIAEVRSIQRSFTTMRTTIQSFAKYVPQDVVYQLVRAKAGMADLAVQEREVTVLFSDIENFTKICEYLGVGDKLLNLMSDYFTAMAEIINSTGGCLLEFIGDAVLAVWNAPNPEEMHAVLAVTAALEMHAFLENVAAQWDAKGYPRVRIRCGIHTAKVLVGNIGAPDRMKYGLLGDGVNTASRLEETNKRYATRTLISEETFKKTRRQIGSKSGNSGNSASNKLKSTKSSSGSFQSMGGSDLFQHRPVDKVVFKGKTKATTLYEIVDFASDRKSTLTPFMSLSPNNARKEENEKKQREFSFEEDRSDMEQIDLSSVPETKSNDSVVHGYMSPPSIDTLSGEHSRLNEDPSAVLSPSAKKLMETAQQTTFSSQDEHFSQMVEKVHTVSQLKEFMLDTHNHAWNCYLGRDFQKAKELFSLVDSVQRELGPRTKVTDFAHDFGDGSEGDKAAMLLRDRCEAFLERAPPPNWSGAEVLKDKHF